MICAPLRPWVVLLAAVAAGAAGCAGQEAPQPAPANDLFNTVRWSTASELENYGFDVYRSTSEDGPFEVVNDRPIPGAGTVDVPQSYEYVDRDIEPDTPYYYYVESISTSGERNRITPVARTKPKPAPGSTQR